MSGKPIRILHVMGGLDRGGIETFMMHVLRRTERTEFAMDFLVHQNRAGAYDEEVLASGALLFRCPHTTRPRAYSREFRRIVCDNGPYDIIHSHVHHYNGYVLKLADGLGVLARVAHAHNDTSHKDAAAGLMRRMYLNQMQRLIARHATHKVACSRLAAASLFGADWEKNTNVHLLPYGIDLQPFRRSFDRCAMRSKLGVPEDALLAIHVGRFDPQKNHGFLMLIAKAMIERQPGFYLLLLGKGDLQPRVEAQVKQLGLDGRVLFAGSRPDVAQCLQAADVFLMPSLHEGLPLAGLEAQSAGLPCLVSDTVTRELDIVPGQLQYFSLNRSPQEWAEAALAMARKAEKRPREQALAVMEKSCCNIENAVSALHRIYYDAVNHR